MCPISPVPKCRPSRPRSARLTAALAGLALCSLAVPECKAAAPNIVFIMADDLGWNDVGYHGSEIKTPHIDSLAEDGVRLNRYYAFPVCSPTRAAFLTGRSPLRLGVDGPIGPSGALPLSEHLLSETLRDSGYQTFLAGKWHLGIDRVAAHPNERGFEHAYGHLGASIDYYSHVWIGSLDWHRNGAVLREEGYSTDLIAAEAVRLVRGRDPTRPMFLYVAFNAPHTPLQVPDEYVQRYPGLKQPQRKVYAAMVSAMDDGVGRILAALREEGLDRDTMVVWASDNGGGRNVGASNLPLRGAKGSALEGGIRVPAVVRWSGTLHGGTEFDQMFTAMDWFPTLTSAIGVARGNREPLDGVDMWSALHKGETVERDATVIGVGGSLAVFRDGWKLVQARVRGSGTVETHLFRIREDPLEARDLIGEHTEVAEELGAVLRSTVRGPSVSSRRPPGARRARQPANQRAEETQPPWIERVASE